jgi:hypothetical protein
MTVRSPQHPLTTGHPLDSLKRARVGFASDDRSVRSCDRIRIAGGGDSDRAVEYVGVEEWSPLDDLMPFDELSALERDVLLKGSLLIVVRRPDGSPRAGKKVVIRGCGFV